MRRICPFIWSACHPKVGELKLHYVPDGATGVVYSVQMVRDRLPAKLAPQQALELGLGPLGLGLIPLSVYQECSVSTRIPIPVQRIISEHYGHDCLPAEISVVLSRFIIAAWDRQWERYRRIIQA